MILGFKDPFAQYVADGSKQHTIRAGNRWNSGMRADFYTGPYRGRERRLLFRAIVTRVDPILLDVGNKYFSKVILICLGERELTQKEAADLAYRDGFRGAQHPLVLMQEFFGPGIFRGQLIHWDYDERFDEIDETSRAMFRMRAKRGRSGSEATEMPSSRPSPQHGSDA